MPPASSARSALHWPRGLARGLWGNRPRGRDRSAQPPETEELQPSPGSNTLTSGCSLRRNVSARSISSLAPGRKIVANSQRSVVAKGRRQRRGGVSCEVRGAGTARGRSGARGKRAALLRTERVPQVLTSSASVMV